MSARRRSSRGTITRRTARRRGQLEITAVVESTGKRNWGGKRPGAGRKRVPGARPGVAHRTRAEHKARHPVHVTLRAARGLPSLRQPRVMGMLRSVLISQTRRKYAHDFHVAHFSVQSNHLHMVVEASGREALRAGMAGFAIAFAKRLNMMLRRNGKVWADRWHGRALATPTEVRNALVYLFRNDTKHGAIARGDGITDPCSSASRFDGWTRPVAAIDPAYAHREGVTQFFLAHAWPRARPRTWLLDKGWKRRGLIDPNEVKTLAEGTSPRR